MLERFSVYVLITSGEQALLDAGGFARSMPDDWDGEDPLARYRKAEIELIAAFVVSSRSAPFARRAG